MWPEILGTGDGFAGLSPWKAVKPHHRRGNGTPIRIGFRASASLQTCALQLSLGAQGLPLAGVRTRSPVQREFPHSAVSVRPLAWREILLPSRPCPSPRGKPSRAAEGRNLPSGGKPTAGRARAGRVVQGPPLRSTLWEQPPFFLSPTCKGAQQRQSEKCKL